METTWDVAIHLVEAEQRASAAAGRAGQLWPKVEALGAVFWAGVVKVLLRYHLDVEFAVRLEHNIVPNLVWLSVIAPEEGVDFELVAVSTLLHW